uniref:Uncharacterized protein n=1 Tax=Anopheles culicifacies TaxID=139723 RepID=A0A182M1C6_9DIPT
MPDNLSGPEEEHETHQHRSTSDTTGDDEEDTNGGEDEDEEEGDDDEDNGHDHPKSHKHDDHQEPAELATGETEQPSSSTESTRVSTTPQTVVAACGSDRGGCDHECRMIYHGNEVEPVVECSCYRGFLLDVRDGRTCHGE